MEVILCSSNTTFFKNYKYEVHLKTCVI